MPTPKFRFYCRVCDKHKKAVAYPEPTCACGRTMDADEHIPADAAQAAQDAALDRLNSAMDRFDDAVDPGAASAARQTSKLEEAEREFVRAGERLEALRRDLK